MDIVMRNFFKKSLLLARSCHSSIFYGELLELNFIHRFSISSLLYLWHFVHSNNDSVISQIFNKISLKSDSRVVQVGTKLRISYVEFIFSRLKYYDCSLDILQSSTKAGWNKYVKKQVHVSARKEWFKSISESKLLSYDYLFIRDPSVDSYIKYSDSYVSRIIFKLRVGSNALYGSKLRYERIQREERICPLCDLSVEDSLHFCAICPVLDPQREEFRSNILLSLSELKNEIDIVFARGALVSLSDLDLMRLMLCSYDLLSFKDLPRFSIWFNLIKEFIFKEAFKAIYQMYTLRINMIHN
jgi:hypothetical protein